MNIKDFNSFLNEDKGQENIVKKDLEQSYGKKVKNISTEIKKKFCRIEVEFEDGLKGFYECEEKEYNVGGYLEMNGKQIPPDKGTPQQEEARSILIDFCESQF